MTTSFEKLQTLLSELFQLDQADLDFGIYRIMNQKRDEITRFLNKELLPQVKTAFAQYHPADKKLLEEKLEEARQAARTLGVDPEETSKVKDILAQIAAFSVDTEALENEVYSHLYSFFRRYYDEGDFISMRRYKEGVYAIPYEGEEVKLHWANADQYYIKTAEYFRDYTFKLPSGKLAHFKIAEADVEKDNVKAAEEKDRRFILAGENAVRVENDEIIIRFEYRVDADKRKQDAINSQTIADVLAAPAAAEWVADLNRLAPIESNPRRTVLEKHLTDYTARNTFDYFIHKNLRGFLRRELDFYIKNEVMRLDDIENENAPRVEQYLSKVKALRSIAHKIIEFLAQIEDFQKKLYLKKKFVVETNYCMTLDRVPEELYPEIAANDAQRKEWVRLFAIDEIKGDLMASGYSVPLTIEFLKSNPFLTLDTKFFDEVFKNKVLKSFEDVDAQTDGVLIHSENFQALNFLGAKYRNKIKCVYIDPPYNSPSSEIVYKNNFKHSSWLSLMFGRLSLSKYLLTPDGSTIVAIDKYEHNGLFSLLAQLQPENDLVSVSVEHNKKGTQGDHFSFSNEYAIFSMSPALKDLNQIELPKEEWEYSNLRNWGGESLRTDARNCFYPIIVKGNEVIGFGEVCQDDFHPDGANVTMPDGTIYIYPIDAEGIERKWRYARNTVESIIDILKIDTAQNGNLQILKAKPTEQFKTMWYSSLYNAGDFGTKIIGGMGFDKSMFSYPKSINTVKDCVYAVSGNEDIVLDYFAGSGTTGHAVIMLNRVEKNSKRKYILAEMGSYFNSVTKPRIQKVIYSKDWKDGKPISRSGSSHCFKYMKLESYEDVLNNLTFKRNETQQLALGQSPAFHENYMLTYMLDTESQHTLLNIESFSLPFEYKLNIATGAVGESKPTNIDLVETFNYLIGLQVKTMQTIRGYKVVTGLTPTNERALIIWRDLTEKGNADLEEFFRKQDYNPRDMEFDLIYVNGDNNLENLRRPDETWKVRLIEDEFMRLMFVTEGL